jgi:DNA invertase Pin-like site-specific DNA recombinase
MPPGGRPLRRPTNRCTTLGYAPKHSPLWHGVGMSVENCGMEYGYVRVSTDDQNPDLQLTALNKAGCRQIFKDEGVSGATAHRPALGRCLKTLSAGDTLIVWKLDRLGRSLRDLIQMLDDLRSRGVRFQSLTEAIDTETPTGRAMWQMIGVLAELERSLITERTRAGVKAAQARGVKFGRKQKLSKHQIDHARKLTGDGESVPQIARLFGVDRATVYRALQKTTG